MWKKLCMIFWSCFPPFFLFSKMMELFGWALGSQLMRLPARGRTSTEFHCLGNCLVSLASLWGQRPGDPSGSPFQCLAVFTEKMLFPRGKSKSPRPCSWSSSPADQCPFCPGDQAWAQYSVLCTSAEQRGFIISLDLLPTLLEIQPSTLLGFLLFLSYSFLVFLTVILDSFLWAVQSQKYVVLCWGL